MAELICGPGKRGDRDQRRSASVDPHHAPSAWAGRQVDAATGLMYDRGFVDERMGDVIGATCDSGERSHSVGARPIEGWDAGLSLRLDAMPGGPQPALGNCSVGKQAWLYQHSAVVLPNINGDRKPAAWLAPMRSTARGFEACRTSPSRLSPSPLPDLGKSLLHQTGDNPTPLMSHGRDNRPLRMGRWRPGGLAEAPGMFRQESRIADVAERMRQQQWDPAKQRYHWPSDYDTTSRH